MIIIGVDPGLVHCGVGVIGTVAGGAHPGEGFEYLYSKVLNPPRGDLAQRLLYLHENLMTIIHDYRAEVMAVEDQFFGKNVQTAFKTGQARGAALLAAARCGLQTLLYPPARVKLAVTGNGRASKEQVRHMVGQILNLRSLPQSLDCSDALAVAICRAMSPEKSSCVP